MTAKKAISQKDMGGLKVVNMADGSSTTDGATKQQVDAAAAFGASLANRGSTTTDHTAINDWDTAIQSKRLDQFAAPTSAVAWNSQKITGLLDPSSAQDASTKNYVDNAVAALSAGLVFKGKVRAATASNVSVTSAPATIDGVTPTAGDVFLLTGQTTGAENGPRVWTAAGAAMAYASNWNTTALASPGSMWVVQQGSFDNQLAILSNDSFTLGTTTGTFVFLNPAASADNDTGYTTTSPVVTAGNTWTVTHGLGSKAITVAVYRTASPYDEVEVYITRDTTTTIGITPDIAMASGEYTVVVQKVI
jgi:hypothetical protein